MWSGGWSKCLPLPNRNVERMTVNPQVPGSSPGRGARIQQYAKNPALTRLGFCVSGLVYLRIVASGDAVAA